MKQHDKVYMLVQADKQINLSRIFGVYSSEEKALIRHRKCIDTFLKMGWVFTNDLSISVKEEMERRGIVDCWEGTIVSPLIGKMKMILYIEEIEVDKDYR